MMRPFDARREGCTLGHAAQSGPTLHCSNPRPHVNDASDPLPALPVPRYLTQLYWWAYVHPRAVRLFERGWLVNLILFGHYARLRDAALDEMGQPITGRSLQVACVYGDLTRRLLQRLAPGATLEVVDILPIQLQNLASKLGADAADSRLSLRQADAAALGEADARYDQVLLFFLLHEQPEAVRRATLAEALRVLRPRGRVVIVDYHRPARWHPLRALMQQVFRRLEPFALDLWTQGVEAYLPQDDGLAFTLRRRRWFGGLYQLLVIERATPP
jgi:ubiquinone/menaquinone biosynthesis C-methylase UbiE